MYCDLKESPQLRIPATSETSQAAGQDTPALRLPESRPFTLFQTMIQPAGRRLRAFLMLPSWRRLS
jgi:hypothetical protein